jgi:ATP-dependent exoDNAse (exonuclease V) beta subunit
MSRAKRQLYLIAEIPPKEGKSLKESRLLRHLLNADRGRSDPLEDIPAIVEWETGERDWWQLISELPPRTPAGALERPPLGPLLRERQPLPARRTPSGEEAFHLPGRVLFSENREAGKRLGLLVHAMLADVEYLQSARDAEITRMENAWRGRHGLTNDAETCRQALAQVREVLSLPGCAPVFEPPAGGTQLWRERSFDLMLDGEWVSGVFDRIRVALDAAGKPVSAWIIDFKTDDTPDDTALAAKVEGYRPQLTLYQKAFARLSGLPASAIKVSLLFTRGGGLVNVE